MGSSGVGPVEKRLSLETVIEEWRKQGEDRLAVVGVDKCITFYRQVYSNMFNTERLSRALMQLENQARKLRNKLKEARDPDGKYEPNKGKLYNNEVLMRLPWSPDTFVSTQMQWVNGALCLMANPDKGDEGEVDSIQLMEALAALLTEMNVSHQAMTRSFGGQERIDYIKIFTHFSAAK